MNVKMMTDQAMEKCRTDAEDLARKVYGNPDSADWLESFVGAEPFVEKTFEIPDFEVEVPIKGAPNEKEIIAKNCVVLHKALKNLPAYILGDTRFWAWLTFTKCYKLAIYKSDIDKDYLKNNWFSKYDNSRRSAMLQTIGSEYFVGALTEKTMSDCDDYALTPYLSGNRELYRNLVYRNISDIYSVSQALIKAMSDYDAVDKTERLKDREAIRSLMKYVSNLGSVMLIDAIPAEQLYQKIYDHLCNISGIRPSE